jgi:hypothetical protein
MPFPSKFRRLLETELKDIDVPDYVWLTYAVCGVERDSCGWAGWAIEVAVKRDCGDDAAGTGNRALSAMDHLLCPTCGRDLFRTESVRYEPSQDQDPPVGQRPGVDYEVLPMEYED